tara:strand:+ start:5117 stop:8035 length:2919 start_codon:yes stop_codon:yes gene_type:complete
MVINTDKLLNKSSGRLAMQKAQQEKMVGGASVNIVLTKKSIKNVDIIKTNVVKIESILKGTLALDKKQLDDKKRDASKKRKEKIETKLETKPNAESGKISMPAAPRMGILDFIKNFIGNVLLGYFAIRLIKHLPKIMPIVKFLGNAADFIIDVGGKLLNGLVTFIDWGYKAYDATRGFIKSIGGENFAKGFDKFLGAIDTALFLTTALAGAMAVEALTGDGGDLNIKPKPGTGGRPKVTTSGGGGAGKPDIRNPLRQKPKVTTGGGSKLRLPKGLKARGGLLGLVFLIPDLIESGMLVSQGRGKDGIRTLISAVSGVAAGMAAYAGVIAGAAALGITGVGIPAAIALAVSGFGASYIAGAAAYNLTEAGLRKMGLVDNDPKTGKPYTYRSGGITRGGKFQRGARRTISKGSRGKYKRVVARKPGEIEIKPGADVGGEDKIFGIFPNPLKAAQRMVDAVNPFGVVKTAGEDLGKTDYFGPILAITSKITLGQKPSQRDYENVGLGINMLIAKGIQDKQLKGGVVAAFAEGGLVDPDVLSAAETGGDISNWVAKTFQGEIESNAQKTLRMIRENAEKKKTSEVQDTGDVVGGTAGQFSPEGLQGEIYKYLLSKGMSDNHALGIMANIHRESGFRPGVSEKGGPGVGLFQYSSGGRKSSFLKSVPDYATNWKGQIDFAVKEDVAPQYFKQNFSSPQDAADWWMREWERPAEYIQNDKGPKIHSQYLAGLQKYKTNKGYEIPTGGTSVATSTVTGSLGDRQKSAGDLGSFIKSLGVAKGSGVHEHPQHGGIKHQHRGKGHGEGRAIDIGGWGGKYGKSKLGSRFVDDQSAILSGINRFAQKTGKRPSLVLHGDNDPGHWDHVHAEYAKGGETLNGPHLAMVGEKGREIVIDNDSVESHPQVKEMLLAINQASNYQGVLNAIRQYAPYDAMSPQTIFIPSPSTPEEDEYDSGMSGGVAFMPIGGGGDDPFATLYQGG